MVPLSGSEIFEGNFKLLKFAENIRPEFYSLFEKTTLVINGRKPFAQDAEIDYEFDSEAEWEEEEPGEELVSENEDEDDGQAHFGQQHLVLLGGGLERRRLRGSKRGRTAASVLTINHREAFEGQEVEDDEEDERPDAHEDKIHPDAVDLKRRKAILLAVRPD